MAKKEQTLQTLNRERDYEERLAKNLTGYFLDSLDYIEDLTQEEKEKIRSSISIILDESLKHERMFAGLMEMVMKNGENNY